MIKNGLKLVVKQMNGPDYTWVCVFFMQLFEKEEDLDLLVGIFCMTSIIQISQYQSVN